MAELVREGDVVHLQLSTLEKMEGLHGDVEVPVSQITDVKVLDDVIHAVQGVKMPGSRLPGVFAMGTFDSRQGTVFAIVHHQHKRGLLVQLNHHHFDALIIGLENPDAVKADLGL